MMRRNQHFTQTHRTRARTRETRKLRIENETKKRRKSETTEFLALFVGVSEHLACSWYSFEFGARNRRCFFLFPNRGEKRNNAK